MRRIVFWGLSTVSVLVLLFSYHTSTSSTVAAAKTSVTSAQAVVPATKNSTTTTTSGGGTAQTFAGDTVDTRYGPVQVQITVAGGKVTAAQTLQVPMEDRHDQEINS